MAGIGWALHCCGPAAVREYDRVLVGRPPTNLGESPIPILDVLTCGDRLVLLRVNRSIFSYRVQVSLGQKERKGNLDVVLESDQVTRQRVLRGAGDGQLQAKPGSYALLQDAKYVVAAGYLDCSFKCHATISGHVVASHALHVDLVTCMSVGERQAVLVTGGRDGQLLVWCCAGQGDVNGRGRGGRSARRTDAAGLSPISARPIRADSSHEAALKLVEMSTDLAVVVSASEGG